MFVLCFSLISAFDDHFKRSQNWWWLDFFSLVLLQWCLFRFSNSASVLLIFPFGSTQCCACLCAVCSCLHANSSVCSWCPQILLGVAIPGAAVHVSFSGSLWVERVDSATGELPGRPRVGGSCTSPISSPNASSQPPSHRQCSATGNEGVVSFTRAVGLGPAEAGDYRSTAAIGLSSVENGEKETRVLLGCCYLMRIKLTALLIP